MTRRQWPDHNTHDSTADEQDLLTNREAVIRLREELAEIDQQLLDLDRRPAESSPEQRARLEKLTTRRRVLSEGIDRHGRRGDR